MKLFQTDSSHIEIYKIAKSLNNKYYVYKIMERQNPITWLVFDQYYYLTNKPAYDISVSHLHLYTLLSSVEKDKILLIIQGLLFLDTIGSSNLKFQDILDPDYYEKYLRNNDSGSGSGYDYGSGDGYGSGSGDGYGYGSDSGDGYGDGSNYGSGTDYGSGSGCGYGSGSGSGSGYGSGYGYGTRSDNS